MQHGLIKVAAAAPDLRVGDCLYNAGQIARTMQQAHEAGASILALPELSLTGATCGDLFFQYGLLEAAVEGLLFLAQQSVGLELLTLVGLPLPLDGRLYNCAAVLYDGAVLGVVPHTTGDGRYFVPAPRDPTILNLEDCQAPFGSRLLFSCRTVPALTLGLEVGVEMRAPQPPSAEHALAGATLIVGMTAHPEQTGRGAGLSATLQSVSSRLSCALMYTEAGCGESTTDRVYSGRRYVYENGGLVARSEPFDSQLLITEIDLERVEADRRRRRWPNVTGQDYTRVGFDLPLRETVLSRPVSATPFVPGEKAEERCEEIFTMQAYALQKRLLHTGAPGVVLGLSGGLDSTLAALSCTRAMRQMGRPPEDVLAVTMPGFGTGNRSYQNVKNLAAALGLPLREIDIRPAVSRHLEDLEHHEQDVVFENAQARERTQILFDLANRDGRLVIGTGNLSELALGYTTFGGDHLSMYGLNASLPKTMVRTLVSYVADHSSPALSAVLREILDAPVSPELLPPDAKGQIQQTEALIGPYALHDFFLYYTLTWGTPPSKILRLAAHAFAGQYTPAEILGWMRVFFTRFFASQFKRSCMPDGVATGPVSLSPRTGFSAPSDACATVILAELDALAAVL